MSAYRFIAMLAAAALAASCNAAEAGPSCASGYHVDRQGNCQPNVAETNRYCPLGAVFHTAPDGWFCDTPSTRIYYY